MLLGNFFGLINFVVDFSFINFFVAIERTNDIVMLGQVYFYWIKWLKLVTVYKLVSFKWGSSPSMATTLCVGLHTLSMWYCMEWKHYALTIIRGTCSVMWYFMERKHYALIIMRVMCSVCNCSFYTINLLHEGIYYYNRNLLL